MDCFNGIYSYLLFGLHYIQMWQVQGGVRRVKVEEMRVRWGWGGDWMTE